MGGNEEWSFEQSGMEEEIAEQFWPEVATVLQTASWQLQTF